MNKNHIHIMHMEYNNTLYNYIRYPFAMIIKFAAKLKYPNSSIIINGESKKILPSHSGIIININDEYVLVEFLGKGMSMMLLEEKKWQHEKAGKIYIEELNIETSDELINAIIFKNISYLYKQKYDVIAAILSFTNRAFNRIKYKITGTFCSAFVASLLYDEGVNLVANENIFSKEEPVDILYSIKMKNGEKIDSVFYL